MRRMEWAWIGMLGLLFLLIVGGLQWWKWVNFGYNGLDLGIYTQVVWALSHGLGFFSSVHDPSYLGDHLELWLIPLAGVYKIFPTGLTLLWAQTLVMAASVIPLALISRRLIGRRGAVIASAVWLAHPLIYNAAMYEFHGLVFALPLLMWSIWAYQARRLGWWLVFILLLLAVREDLPLLVAGWALLAGIERRSWQWWLIPICLSIAWFWAAQAIIGAAQPTGEYKFLAFYSWMGESFSDLATFPFRHPWVFLQHLFQPRNWVTTIGFLLSFGFLPLLRLRRLLPVGLLFVQLLLVGAESDSILRLHYVIPYIPFLAWASLVTLKDLRAGRLRLPISGLATIILPIIAVIGPIYAHLVYGPAEWPWRTRINTGLTDSTVLAWGVQQVPKDAAVLTTFNLLPHLADRENIFSLNYLHLGRRQYSETPYRIPVQIDLAIIDWQQYYHYQFLYRQTLFEGLTGAERFEDLLKKQGLRLGAWVDNLAIYTRNGQSDYQPITQLSSTIKTDTELRILETPQLMTVPNPVGGTQTELTLHWQNGATRERPLSIHFTARQNDIVAWESTRLLGQGGHPSDSWTPNQTWEARYRFVFPENLRGTFELRAQVVQLEARLRLDRVRRFTPVVTKTTPGLEIPLGEWSL